MKINNFKKKLIAWGAADQCIVMKPIIESLGACYDVLIDDTPGKTAPIEVSEFLNGVSAFEEWKKGRNMQEYGFLITIGNPYGFIRCKLHNYLKSFDIEPVTVCDISSLIDEGVQISEGCQIMKGAIINTETKIGKQCIINTKALVEHHGLLSDGVEIGPGVTVCGRVNINRYSWIGAGATILPRLCVGENTIVGAGSLVRKDVGDNIVVAGVPSKLIKQNEFKIYND